MTTATTGQYEIEDRGDGYHFRYRVRSETDFISPFGCMDDCEYWSWLGSHVGMDREDFSVVDNRMILFKNFADAVAFKLRWNGIRPRRRV